MPRGGCPLRGGQSLTEATWKELFVPLWSRSWHMQEINKAKISMSLVGRQRGEGAQPLPHVQSKNGCMRCPGATGQELGTPGSPS